MRYAVVNKKTLKVVNVVEWDGKTNWEPPQGCTVVIAPRASRGDIYDPESNSFFQDILQNIIRE
jgi:hypothetical protein